MYKNSKLVVAVDGVPLCDLVDQVEPKDSQFEITLHSDGSITLVQTVILKNNPDIAARCQVCFVKEGQLRAGFSTETVQSGARDATCVPDGVYELYLMYGQNVISNTITFKKTGTTFQILD